MSKRTPLASRGLTISVLTTLRGIAFGFGVTVAASGSSSATSPTKELAVIYPPITDASADRLVAASNTKTSAGFVAAPMPNQAAYTPRSVGTPGPEVAPSLFQGNRNFRGDGFTPGSSPQIAQQSRRVSMPGISVKVPLY